MKVFSFEQVRLFLDQHCSEIKPSQTRILYPVIERITRKMQLGIEFKPILIDVDHQLIVDGHHRYLSKNLLEKEINHVAWTKSPSTETFQWNLLQLEYGNDPMELVRKYDWEDEEHLRQSNS